MAVLSPPEVLLFWCVGYWLIRKLVMERCKLVLGCWVEVAVSGKWGRGRIWGAEVHLNLRKAGVGPCKGERREGEVWFADWSALIWRKLLVLWPKRAQMSLSNLFGVTFGS